METSNIVIKYHVRPSPLLWKSVELFYGSICDFPRHWIFFYADAIDYAPYKSKNGKSHKSTLPHVDLYVCEARLWKEQGQEKVSPVEQSGSPGFLCPKTGNLVHATSITSHKATLSDVNRLG